MWWPYPYYQLFWRLRQRLLVEVSPGYIVKSCPQKSKTEGQQEIAQWVGKGIWCQARGLSLIPRTHMVKGESLLQKVVL